MSAFDTSHASVPAPHAAPPRSSPPIPLRTRWSMYLRLLAIQGSWNYEILLGNGVGFCIEPALRQLPGGAGGAAYRAALARQSNYFNAHPYLASVAVGALARAELDGEPPEKIERFRIALCGPLGSLGDRLVWAAWLPTCSLVALGVYGLGGGALLTALVFLLLFNAGHLALRAWGLHVGVTRGLRVASALGTPWLRHGPEWVGRVGAVLSGMAIPLALYRMAGSAALAPSSFLLVVLLAGLGGAVLLRIPARLEGWRLAIVALVLYVLLTVVR